MRCVECGSQKSGAQRGWVTVLAPSDALRIHYCPDCLAKLVSRSAVANEVDDSPNDE